MPRTAPYLLTLLIFLLAGWFPAAGNLAGAKSGTTGGYDVSYDYDELNRITMVYRGQEGIDPTATELAAYNYDANGSGYSNGVQHAYTYNPVNRLTDLGIRSRDLTVPSSSYIPLQGYSYQLDKNGHRTRISELGGRTINHTFDKLHRLTREIITSSQNSDHPALGTRHPRLLLPGSTSAVVGTNLKMCPTNGRRYFLKNNNGHPISSLNCSPSKQCNRSSNRASIRSLRDSCHGA